MVISFSFGDFIINPGCSMSQESVLFPGRDTAIEKFVWCAHYEDGTKVQSIETKIENLSRNGLRVFELLEDDAVVFSIQLLQGDTFAFRKRTAAKAGVGFLYRLYAVCITRDDISTYFWVDETTKNVHVTRLNAGEDLTGRFYKFSPVENDETPIT